MGGDKSPQIIQGGYPPQLDFFAGFENLKKV
jgi:hypothetical protein